MKVEVAQEYLYTYISKFTPEFLIYYLKNTPLYQENVENMKY